jgi:glycine oxidase
MHGPAKSSGLPIYKAVDLCGRLLMQATIVGAGIIGLSIAWELACRGARVRVLEMGIAGRQTTWAAAGILPAARLDTATDPLDRLRGFSHQIYPEWTRRLHEVTGIDSGYIRSGGIYLASGIGEAASLLATLNDQRDLGIDITALDRERLKVEEPGIAAWADSDRFRAAALSSDEWQIRPPEHVKALVTACLSKGVQIEQDVHIELTSDEASQRVQLRSAFSGSLPDDHDALILCGGVWNGQLASRLGLGHSVIPIRGQMLLYQCPAPPVQRIVNEGHRYVVPRPDGKLLVGSCEEEVGFQQGTTPEMLGPLQAWAEAVLPCLKALTPVKSWSGLRPATFDGFPLLGKVPGLVDTYVAAGHYRSGIHLAPATAHVISDLLFDQVPRIDIGAFGIGRMMSMP